MSLKITKSQIKVGQKMIVSKSVYESSTYGYKSVEGLGIIDPLGGRTINKPVAIGTELEILKYNAGNTSVVVTDGVNNYQGYWTTLKGMCDLGDFPNLGAGSIDLVIFLNGKKWKPKKFKDISKVKASLMSGMGYLSLVYDLAHSKFKNRSPEVWYSAPEWVGVGGDLTRKDFVNIEIFEWSNRKIGNLVTFDALEYYDSLMDFAAVTAQFGSAVRGVYKQHKDGGIYNYILCFVSEEYKGKYPYYEDMKESPTIKQALKDSGVKGTRKSTKSGKTAIAFKTSGEMYKVAKILNDLESEYYVLDIAGSELEEKDGSFIVSENRKSVIAELLSED